MLYHTARETTDNVRKESASNHDDNDNNSEEDDGDDDDGADHGLERPRQESLRPPSRQHRSCRSEAVTQPIGGCSSSPSPSPSTSPSLAVAIAVRSLSDFVRFPFGHFGMAPFPHFGRTLCVLGHSEPQQQHNDAADM